MDPSIRTFGRYRIPSIGVFGRLTYLLTEILWGAIAFVLLRRADALRTAAGTILALYPIAYLWDWYTLSVGVFSIDLRTGADIAGIPVEEHVFMVVVPALVLGIHETVHDGSVEHETAVGNLRERLVPDRMAD